MAFCRRIFRSTSTTPVTDPSMAPEGCSTFYVLAPVAHLGKAPLDWDGEIGKLLEDRILDEIERRLIPDIRSRIVTEVPLCADRFRA